MGDEQKATGVRFADVAGIDNIKDDIKVVMDMLLGAQEYKAIGAAPFRVRAFAVALCVQTRDHATAPLQRHPLQAIA